MKLKTLCSISGIGIVLSFASCAANHRGLVSHYHSERYQIDITLEADSPAEMINFYDSHEFDIMKREVRRAAEIAASELSATIVNHTSKAHIEQ
ncbi:MAG: hypothetical protein HY286_07935 [Planctomycetes bacterium]|nr:hypothetical protein [Planctomycetota bacterium]